MSVSFLLSCSTIISGYSSHTPAPLPSGPGVETRHTKPQPKSSRRAALLARQKRGAAGAYPAITTKAGRAIPTEGKDFRCCGACSGRQPGRIFQKENTVNIYSAGLDFAEEDFQLSIHRCTKSQDWRESHCSNPMIPANASKAPHQGNRKNRAERKIPTNRPVVIQLARHSLVKCCTVSCVP